MVLSVVSWNMLQVWVVGEGFLGQRLFGQLVCEWFHDITSPYPHSTILSLSLFLRGCDT